MESEKSGFVNKMSDIWRKMQVKVYFLTVEKRERYSNITSLD